jgi:hypothetical protein
LDCILVEVLTTAAKDPNRGAAGAARSFNFRMTFID